MSSRSPVRNFEEFWVTFNNRYPFFSLRGVDWKAQYDTFRPSVSANTTDDELFDILCAMVDPLDDGHVEIYARIGRSKRKREFTAEKPTRFIREFTDKGIKKLFKVTEQTLASNGFGPIAKTNAWMLRYGRAAEFGYMRILELEDIKKRKVTSAIDTIARDFPELKGFIIDIRDNPGGEDDIALGIINRFADEKRVAFNRRTKIGPGEDDFGPLKTWYLEPKGDAQFTRPTVLLTSDSVFSGGESFALAIRELPHVTILGDHTNGIFSYTLDKTLPNGWEYCLSYQVYLSADMVCYEGKGVPPDIKLLNSKADIENGVDPLIVRALALLRSSDAAVAT
ncbi:MAG: S41 family peptidase [Hyphomicrobiaceae bacterium]